MGAIPSKESVYLFSFFRGTYEVGLIPLTKHFFGSNEEGSKNEESGSIVHPHQFNEPIKNENHILPSGEQYSTLSADVIDRKQLRSQLLKMHRDPAVLYPNARDTDNMIQTIRSHLQREKEYSNRTNNDDDREVLHSGTTFQKVDENSIANSNVNSAEIGSLENGMLRSVPKAHAIKRPEVEKDSSASMASIESVTSNDDVFPPDIDSAIFQENFWNVIPEPNFTEEDLDNFLELVEKEMYETDEDMLTDSRYALEIGSLLSPRSLKAAAGLPSAATTTTTDDDVAEPSQKHQPRAFIPIPCALCLAYPHTKERRGCFPLEGRNINIIGYFGCMTKEMQEVFKVTKRNTEFNREKAGLSTNLDAVFTSGEVTGDNPTTAESSDHTPPLQRGVHLYFNTAVLTSAGDRTLERVLILAPAMLRQEFHAIHRRFLINQKLRDQNRAQQNGKDGALKTAPQPFKSCLHETTSRSTPISLNGCPITNSTSTLQGLDSSVRKGRSVDPLMSIAFSPLPRGVFTPGIYWKQRSGKRKGQNRQSLADKNGGHQIDSENDFKCSSDSSEEIKASHQFHQHCINHFFRSPSTKNTFFNEVTDPCTGVQLSNTEEDSISWSFIRRLNTISVTIELSSNNYPALKSLTENFAFLNTQVDIDPNEMVISLVNLCNLDKNTNNCPHGRGVGVSNQSADNNSKEVPPSSLKTAVHTVETPVEKTTEDTVDKSKEIPDIGNEISKVHLPDAVNDSCIIQSKALGVTKESVCDTDGSRKISNCDAVSPSCTITPDSGVVILIQASLFRQAVLWLSCLLCKPLSLQNGCWIQYKLKREFKEVRNVLQEKDTIVTNWRNSERQRALTYLGPNTEHLLAHVRLLQEEAELTRFLLKTQSSSLRVFTTQDNRKYTLHRGKAGTMLIAAREFSMNHTSSDKQIGNTSTTSTLMRTAKSSQKSDHTLHESRQSPQECAEAKGSVSGNEPCADCQEHMIQMDSDSPLPGAFSAKAAHKEHSRFKSSLRRYQRHFLSSGPQNVRNKPPLLIHQLPQAPPPPFIIEGGNNTLVQPSTPWVGFLPYRYGTPQIFLPFPSDASVGCANPADAAILVSLRYGLPQAQPQFVMKEPLGPLRNLSATQYNYQEIQNPDTNLVSPDSLTSSVKHDLFNKESCWFARNTPHADRVETSTTGVSNTHEQGSCTLESAFTVPGSEVVLNSHQMRDHQDDVSNHVESSRTSLLTDPFLIGIWPPGAVTQNANTANASNKLGAIGTANDSPWDSNLHYINNASLNISEPALVCLGNTATSFPDSVFEVVTHGPHISTGVGGGTMDVSLRDLPCPQVHIPPPSYPQQVVVTSPSKLPNNLSCNPDNPHLTAFYMGDMDSSIKNCASAVNLNSVSSMPEKVPGYVSVGHIPLLTDASTISHGSTILGSERSPFLEAPTCLCNDRMDTCGTKAQNPFFLMTPSCQDNRGDVWIPQLPLSVMEPQAAPFQKQHQHQPGGHRRVISHSPPAMPHAPLFPQATPISFQPTLGLGATMPQVSDPFGVAQRLPCNRYRKSGVHPHE